VIANESGDNTTPSWVCYPDVKQRCLYPTHYTLHPTPYTPPYTLHPTPHTIHRTPQIINLKSPSNQKNVLTSLFTNRRNVKSQNPNAPFQVTALHVSVMQRKLIVMMKSRTPPPRRVGKAAERAGTKYASSVVCPVSFWRFVLNRLYVLSPSVYSRRSATPTGDATTPLHSLPAFVKPFRSCRSFISSPLWSH